MSVSLINNRFGYQPAAVKAPKLFAPINAAQKKDQQEELPVTTLEKNEDTIEISEEGRLAAEQEKAAGALPGEEDSGEDSSEGQSGKVAVNQSKRARQIAAAKSKDQVRQVIALLQKDMSDCKAGLEQGMCDEAEIAKVQALLNQAKARLSQVPQEAEDELGISEFDLAGLM